MIGRAIPVMHALSGYGAPMAAGVPGGTGGMMMQQGPYGIGGTFPQQMTLQGLPPGFAPRLGNRAHALAYWNARFNPMGYSA